MPDKPDAFYDHFVRELNAGNAALFAGAGLSVAAGYVDWKTLLRGVAHGLGLNVDDEADLVSLAQYHVNAEGGNRATLNRLIMERFTEDTKLTQNHRLLARMPIHTVWTTNYDDLLERAYREAGKKIDVKITPESLARGVPFSDVVIHKMHGDISNPNEAVLIKDDYESYNEQREAFSIKLKGDLVSKTFLFLGFSFSDPNIDFVLSRIRLLLGKAQPEHYCVMRRVPAPLGKDGAALAKYEYERTKQGLRVTDLRRYGIRPILVDEYSEITTLLEELHRRSRLKHVFVSGSAHDPAPLGQPKLDDLARALGYELIRSGCHLISGYGGGVGGPLMLGATEACYDNELGDVSRRIWVHPLPRITPQRLTIEAFKRKYREEMLQRAGFAVFLAGNKLDRTTLAAVPGMGVMQEFEIAQKLGICPIPIGASGHVAREIWTMVGRDLLRYYPGADVAEPFARLGDENAPVEELVKAVFEIMRLMQRR